MENIFVPYGQMMLTKLENGKMYEVIVCERCHRPNHSRDLCFADTYADGSTIRHYCGKCGRYHPATCQSDDSCCNIL